MAVALYIFCQTIAAQLSAKNHATLCVKLNVTDSAQL